MSLNSDEILRLGKLARLYISPEEQEATAQQINNIINLVGQLSKHDTRGLEPLAHPLAVLAPVALRLRVDEATEPNAREANLACAPAVEKGLFLVPKVIE